MGEGDRIMNLGALLVLFKFAEEAGLLKRQIRDPTSTAGVRPICGVGEKPVYFEATDQYRCIPKALDI